MWGRRQIARAGVIGGVALATLAGPATAPADAACLYVDFWVYIEDTDSDGHDEPEYVHLGCVTDTDYPWVLSVPASGNRDNLPAGTPNGFYLQTHIPAPI